VTCLCGGVSRDYVDQGRLWARHSSLPRRKSVEDPAFDRRSLISWLPSRLQHFKPSERDAQARAELLDQVFEILYERFGSGFDVEYVGIGRYAADITQAPMEVAIIVSIGHPVLFRH